MNMTSSARGPMPILLNASQEDASFRSGPGSHAGLSTSSLPLSARPLRVALVGASLPMRLSSDLRGSSTMPACDVVRVSDSVADAARSLRQAAIDIVLIEIGEVDDSVLPHVDAIRRVAADGAMLVVLYHFGASTTLEQLRMHDCLLAREPASPADILRLCATSMRKAERPVAPELSSLLPAQTTPEPGYTPVPPSRFNHAALRAISDAASAVQCECPRHLADILAMLGSFERYSQQCVGRNPQDSLLHRELAHAAGRARAILEQALVKLARSEGLPLPGEEAPERPA